MTTGKTESKTYTPEVGDVIELTGFSRRYTVLGVRPCEKGPCDYEVRIDLPAPDRHPLLRWFGEPKPIPTWVHAVGASPA